MSKVKKTLKFLRSLDRSQILVALFLGIIILLSSVNLIRDLRSYGLKPFGFVESAFAQIFPQDNIIAQSLPKAGNLPASLCGDKIDLLQYMFAEGGAGYNLKYCTNKGPGPVPQNMSLEKTTFEGHPAFKLHKGNDYELYFYDDQNIYFVEDTSWDGTCQDGLRAYYRVFNPATDSVGGAIPRCWSPGEQKESPQQIRTYYRDSDTPSGKECTANEQPTVTTPTLQIDYAQKGDYGPQIDNLYDNNGTIVMKNVAGAGTGEQKFYSKGYGLTGFYFNNSGTVEFHSSIQTDEVDPVLSCGVQGDNVSILNNLKSPKVDIVDSPDKCVAYNQYTGKPLRSINAGGGTSLESGKGGINQGNLGWNNEIQFIQGDNSLKTDLKMGNILGLFLEPNVGNAVSFIQNANDAGLLPVVRLCYSDSCGFSLYDDSIPNFYKEVSAKVGDGYVFVGLVGPNEPGTNGEAAAFTKRAGDADNVPYDDLVNKANYFAEQLQNVRVKLGGNMFIAPAAFNLTNRSLGHDDTKEYLARSLKYELFDYLAGNTYNTAGQSAYHYYEESGAKAAVDSNGLKMIITEFGKFSGTDKDLKDAFMQFCDDSNVDGVLFFRSFEDGELGAGQPKPLSVPITAIYDMTSSCARPRPWIDCNFDSTLYANNASKPSSTINSTAKSVYSKTEDSKGDATFKVNCVSNNCDYKIEKTMKVRAPIKEFGSNSSFGTETKNFVPICANVSSFLSSKIYDPLNQFAGKVGDNYPMPWLGSAINCSTELIKASDEYAGSSDTKMYSSPGAVILNTKADIEGDIIKQVVARQYDGSTCLQVDKEGKAYIPDERTVYYKGKAVDKCPVDSIKIVRYYNPFSTPQEYKSVPEAGSNLKYLVNPDDYISGPEVVVSSSQQVNVGNFSQMCSQYAERNVNPAIKYVAGNNLDCTVKNQQFDGYSCSNFFANCTQESIQNGQCYLNKFVSADVLDDLRNNCFEYKPKGEDKIYYRDNSFADLPQNMDISQVYDSLNTLYQRLNNILKNRKMKLVVNNNIGWNLEGYSMLRDGNSESKGSKTSLYSSTDPENTYRSDIENHPEATAQVTGPQIFDNSINMARGTSSSAVKKTNYYYDWLGYLDLFQEYYSVYQNNSSFAGEQRIPNPFYNQAGAPNNDQQYLLITGLSAQYVSLPLLSCDQRNIGNSLTNSMLKADSNIQSKLTAYLQESNPQLTGDALTTAVNRLIDDIWPYDYTISNKDATCVEDAPDTRLTNKLETELCKRGYIVEGACGNKCITPVTPKPISSPVNPTPTDPSVPTIPTVPTPGGLSFIYPTSTTVVASGYGCGGDKSRPGSEGQPADCHTGVDFIRTEGTSIVASEAGTVIIAGSDTRNAPNYQDCFGNASGAYGCLVEIQHSNGFITLYAHMSEILVSKDQIVTKGQVIGKIGHTGLADGSHLHFEMRTKGSDCYDGDAGQLGKCTEDPMKYLSGSASSDFVIACQPQDYTVTPWVGKCNEWNCGGAASFQDSLSCVTGIGYFHNSMDEWIDRYGPFCDNETYKTKLLPFAYNFTKFYDSYLPPGTTGGRTCGDLPPGDRRPEDVGMACPAYGSRVGTEAYNYYRSALKKCSIPSAQTNWTSENSFGRSPEELADYMMNTLDVNYIGLHLKNTPREKVINVLQKAQEQNLNPFIVIGIWGTESWFGQYNKQCNISQ